MIAAAMIVVRNKTAATDHATIALLNTPPRIVGTVAPLIASAPLSAIHFNSSWRSCADRQRCSGSFARHFFTARSSGDAGATFGIGGGSSRRIALIKLA
jgi:hypothetical protein